MSKEWSGAPGGCCEEWSVHAQLTLNPPAGGGLGREPGARGDSGYGSEKGCVGPTARATCSVTLAGHHTVTLTCSEIPLSPQQHQPPLVVQPHQPRERWVFCNHHDKQARQAAPPPPPPPPVYKDAAIQTSTSHIPQLFEPPSQPSEAKPKNKALRRSPARLKHRPKRTKSGGDLSQSRSAGGASSSDGKKNPRTVHIDVYCTGSESSDSSNSTEEESNSTPQTVFESDRLRVTHQRAHSDSLPHSLQRQKRCVLSNQSIPSVSSGYPSAMSSLVSGTDGFSLTSGSFLSSGVASSAAVTSAKDTDFSSRDSFDYDNSFDKLRIREKERLWAAQRAQGAMLEESSDSSSDSEEGMAWSFERGNFLKREDTVKRPPDSLRKSSSAHVELSKSGSLSDSEACSLKYKRDSIKKPYESIFHNLSKAKKFGPIISSLKKPGHHVGPSKNPNCTCDTCRYFFEHVCCRNRTRSLGDRPL